MSLVHNRTTECMKSELDLFQSPPTQLSLDKGGWYEYPPSASLTENGPLEFYVTGSGNEYIDLLHTRLYIKAKIVDGNGVNLPNNELVAPVNYLLASLFSQVDVTLNGKSVGHPNNLYPYRAMIEQLMNFGPEAAHSHLQNGLFYKDTAGFMEETNPNRTNVLRLVDEHDDRDIIGDVDIIDADNHHLNGVVNLTPNIARGNRGLHERWLITRNSQWFELEGPIHADIFQQERFLLNSVDLGLKFTRSRPDFALMTGTGVGYKIQIQDATLFVRKMAISDSVFLAHQQALLHSNAIYPINYVAMKSFSIPAGNRVGPQDNLFLGNLPQEMVVVFVDNAALSGSYVHNPFNFKHLNIRHMSCRYGNETIPGKPLLMDFDSANGGIYGRIYHQMFITNGKVMKDYGSLVERKDFPRGYAMFAFNFRPDIDGKGCYNLKKTGAVQLQVEFAQALPNTVNMIVYGAFDSYFEINASRDIITIS